MPRNAQVQLQTVDIAADIEARKAAAQARFGAPAEKAPAAPKQDKTEKIAQARLSMAEQVDVLIAKAQELAAALRSEARAEVPTLSLIVNKELNAEVQLVRSRSAGTGVTDLDFQVHILGRDRAEVKAAKAAAKAARKGARSSESDS